MPEPTRLAAPGNQPGEPPTGITADFHPLADHHPFSRVGGHRIAKFTLFLLNTAVAGGWAAEDRKGHYPEIREEIDQRIDRC